MNEPDDFCFRLETHRLLQLCRAQMKLSLQQSDTDVVQLTQSFQNLVNLCPQLESIVKRLNLSSDEEIEALHQIMSTQVTQSIIAFQFYDRLSQQLNHVIDNLDLLGNLIQDNGTLADDNKWLELRSHILASYSMASEHVIHQAIMSGKGIDEALSLHQASLGAQDDEIELF